MMTLVALFAVTTSAWAEDYVACIGSKNYTTLLTACQQVKSGQTIKLLKDVSGGHDVFGVDAGFPVTLDLNGHTISNPDNEAVIALRAGSQITIIDSSTGTPGGVIGITAGARGGKIILMAGRYNIANKDAATILQHIADINWEIPFGYKLVDIPDHTDGFYVQVVPDGTPLTRGTGDLSNTWTLDALPAGNVMLLVDLYELTGLAWKLDGATLTDESEVNYCVGFPLNLPTLENPNDLAVSYSSSKTSIAEIDETTGEITIKGVSGETTIKAKFDGDNTYEDKTVTYKLVVSQPLTLTVTQTDHGTVTVEGAADPDAGIIEDFEEYEVDSKIVESAVGASNMWWTTYYGDSYEDGVVYYFDNSKRGKLTEDTDLIFKLGGKTSGVWEYAFDVFVPEEKIGYFGMLHNYQSMDGAWAMDCFLNGSYDENSGTTTYSSEQSTLYVGGETVALPPCPANKWMNIRMVIDIDKDVAKLYFDGKLIHTWTWSVDDGDNNAEPNHKLDVTEFYCWKENMEFYIDNISFHQISNVIDNGDGTYKVIPGTDVTLKAEANEGYHLASWSNNAAVTEDGMQTLTVNETMEVSATFTENVYVTVPAGDYVTYYSNENLTVDENSDAVLYTITDVDGNTATATEIESANANMPFLVYNPTSTELIVRLFPTNDVINQSVYPGFKGTLTDKTFTAAEMAATDHYVVNKAKFVWVKDPGTILAHRCWLELTKNSAARSLNIVFGDATAIDHSPLTIDHADGDIYDLQGRKIVHGTLSNGTLRKGVYIQNGKKVVNK